jgi:hypothetical protein
MVSPGELRLMSALYDDSTDAIKPTIDADNTVVYPTVERTVDEQDLPAIDTLDSLVEREILVETYSRKAYICPSCDIERMGYSRACPECGSTHTIGRVVARHPDCEYAGPADEFERNGGRRSCPLCKTFVMIAELEYDQKHHCHDCGATFSQPQHRVQCRICFNTYNPKQVPERTFYEYHLTDHGRAWYHIQMMTRDRIRERFEEREFTTRIDISIANGSASYPVHVDAEHTVLDLRIIAGIYDDLQLTDLDYLQEAAEQAMAHPLVVITNRVVSKQILRQLQDRQINLLAVQHDGTLSSEYAVHDAPPDTIPRV